MSKVFVIDMSAIIVNYMLFILTWKIRWPCCDCTPENSINFTKYIRIKRIVIGISKYDSHEKHRKDHLINFVTYEVELVLLN